MRHLRSCKPIHRMTSRATDGKGLMPSVIDLTETSNDLESCRPIQNIKTSSVQVSGKGLISSVIDLTETSSDQESLPGSERASVIDISSRESTPVPDFSSDVEVTEKLHGSLALSNFENVSKTERPDCNFQTENLQVKHFSTCSSSSNMQRLATLLSLQKSQNVKHFQRLSRPVATLASGPIAPGCHKNFHSPKRDAETNIDENVAIKRTKSSPTMKAKENIGVAFREWEYTSFGRDCERNRWPGTTFSLMTYNVLAQNLLRDNMNLYENMAEECLEWEYRKANLLKEFEFHKPDILCLQEINNEHYKDFFLPNLEALGYRGVYQQRTGDKLDGCATFYRKDKFSLTFEQPVLYFREGSSLTDRDNVGLIVKLLPRSGREAICVANTHLLYNPRRGDIKLLQLMTLLAEMDNVTQGHHHTPVILCGDFNATPYSYMYKFITQGYLRYEGLNKSQISAQRSHHRLSNVLDRQLIPSNLNISDQCKYLHLHLSENYVRQSHHGHSSGHYAHHGHHHHYHHHHQPTATQNSGFLWHRFHFVSAYNHYIRRTGEPEVTSQQDERESCNVDYLFYSVHSRNSKTRRGKYSTRNIAEGKLRLVARWGLMSQDEISQIGNLPNENNPSDHLPLLVKFYMES